MEAQNSIPAALPPNPPFCYPKFGSTFSIAHFVVDRRSISSFDSQYHTIHLNKSIMPILFGLGANPTKLAVMNTMFHQVQSP
jgi:hypothetical protein